MGGSLGVLTLDQVLELLEAPAPAPAGGSAAALAAAAAASLVAMVACGSRAWPEGNAAAGSARELRARLVVLAEADARAVAGLLELLRESGSADPDEKRSSLLLAACRPPLAIIDAAAEIAELAAEAEAKGKGVMRADAAVAGVLARAAATAALLVIEANLAGADAGAASTERSGLLQQARDAAARAAGWTAGSGSTDMTSTP